MIKNKEAMRRIIVASFLSVPVLASIISTLHLVNFFRLGNHDWMSYMLAVTFEVGSIASFVALSVLDKIKKGMIYFVFVILFFLQLIGNVYFSFEYINIMLATHPQWMATFMELVRPIYEADSVSTYKFILSIIIGVPIPLVSLSFLKSLVDYLKVDENKPVSDASENAAKEKPEPIAANVSTSEELNRINDTTLEKISERTTEMSEKNHATPSEHVEKIDAVEFINDLLTKELDKINQDVSASDSFVELPTITEEKPAEDGSIAPYTNHDQ